MTLLLYYDLPRFGIPLLYSRQITAIITFSFFAAIPLYKSVRDFRKLTAYASKDLKHEAKKWATKIENKK